MSSIYINNLGHHISSIFTVWWLLLTAMMGLWLILMVSSLLIKEGREREAQLAFLGGWFWLSFGLISFSGAKIFEYFF